MATKSDIGAKISLDGEKEYKQSLTQIIQQNKTLDAEMKNLVASFDKSTKAQEKNEKIATQLNKQIQNQEKYIEQLKQGYEKSAKATGENSTETLRWQEKIEKAETALKKMQSELKDVTGIKSFADNLSDASKKLDDIAQKATNVGTNMSKYITAPILAVGTASLASFKEVDSGLDIIITKTGASGDALESMQSIAKDIATTLPTSFEDVGNAVGEVNTRFGVTGDQLEDISAQFVKFAQINGVDVTSAVDSAQQAMSAFGLGADNASSFLDMLNSVGQRTGISVTSLASSLVSNGSALRELGFNASDAANFLGDLELSGVDASQVMSGLAKVQASAAKEGKSMADVLSTAFSSSANAIEIFGTKAGPKLYESMQSGVLSLDMFVAGTTSLDDSLGSVSDTFDATLDPIDDWTVAMNNLKVTGSEFGSSLQTSLTPLIQEFTNMIKNLNTWWTGLDETQQQNIISIAGVVAAAGPLIIGFGKVADGVSKVMKVGSSLATTFTNLGGITGMLSSAIAFLSSPLGIAVASIGAVIAIGVLLYKNWDTVKETAYKMGNAIGETFNNIKKSVSDSMENAKNTVNNAIEKIKGFFKFEWSLPHLKMPHFTISGSFSLNPPSVPSFGIDWYKKAYDNAVLFNKPTVLATSGGLKGFGDGAGGEMVIGQNLLMNTLSKAVQNAGAGNITVNVYPSDGMDEQSLAERVAATLSDMLGRDQEVFA